MGDGTLCTKSSVIQCAACRTKRPVSQLRRSRGANYVPNAPREAWNPIFYFCTCDPKRRKALCYNPGNGHIVVPPNARALVIR